jgi:hypothetical protein
MAGASSKAGFTSGAAASASFNAIGYFRKTTKASGREAASYPPIAYYYTPEI